MSCTPCAPLRPHLLSLSSCAALALFWLVVVCKMINRWPSQAKVYYNFIFFHGSNLRPNQCDNGSPHALSLHCLLSNIYITAVADYYLIVVFHC